MPERSTSPILEDIDEFTRGVLKYWFGLKSKLAKDYCIFSIFILALLLLAVFSSFQQVVPEHDMY